MNDRETPQKFSSILEQSTLAWRHLLDCLLAFCRRATSTAERLLHTHQLSNQLQI